MPRLPSIEKKTLKLGFMPLLDCAPLIVAREKGFFKQYGLNVVLQKESSWASILDKVSYGLYDGAHMLAPMPLAATLGLNGKTTPMVTALTLSQNGTAITLSQELYFGLSERVDDWSDLNQIGESFKALLHELNYKPIIATVYPYSNHHYLLRYWLQQLKIDTLEDIQLVAVPPSKMLDNLSNGVIDGYCVGEPWNSLALIQQSGGLLTTGHQIWGSHMEKVLGVTQAWAKAYPHTHEALIKAVYSACQWSEDPENHDELLNLLSLPPYLDKAAEALKGFTSPYSMEQHYAGGNLNHPDRQQGIFLLEQMEACQQIEDPSKLDYEQVSEQVFRKDLFQRWCG